MVECELVDVVDTVREESDKVGSFRGARLGDQFFQSHLNALGKIDGVGEVERLVLLECLQHFNEFHILGRTTKKRWRKKVKMICHTVPSLFFCDGKFTVP